MAKITKSVRMSEDTIAHLADLKVLLKENEGDLIERAVKMLFDNRKTVYEQDIEERRIKLEKKAS